MSPHMLLLPAPPSRLAPQSGGTPIPSAIGMTRSLGIVASAWLCWPASASDDPANASIYLIAAEPPHTSENVLVEGARPAVLYRLEGDALRKTRTIVTRRQSAKAVHVFHEHGFGVVVSRGADYRSFLVDVQDFADMSRQRSVDMDLACEDGFCALLASGLLRLGGRLVYAVKGEVGTYGGLYLDTWEPAEGIDRWPFRKDAYRYGQGGYRVPGVRGSLKELDGILGYLHDGGTKVFPVGWSLPPNTPRDAWFTPDAPEGSRSAVGWYLETDLVRAVRGRTWGPDSPVDKSTKDRTWMALDKQTNRWSPVTLFGRLFGLQAFRRWIVFTEKHYDLPDDFDWELLEAQRSPGFLSAAERFRKFGRPPTGRFMFYDLRSETVHALETGEPNSEALYVDGRDRAYLRVSDELWRVPLEEDGPGPVTVLAKQPELWAVHWLVMGSP